jgi:hypothetical protein
MASFYTISLRRFYGAQSIPLVPASKVSAVDQQQQRTASDTGRSA